MSGTLNLSDTANSDPTLTLSGMIRRLQSGDELAWDRFVELYTPLVWQWCRRLCLDPATADDVIQNVFMAVAIAISQYQPTGPFKGWLWQITRNKVMDHFRERQDEPHAVGGSDFLLQINELPDSEPAEPSSAHGTDALTLRALEIIRKDVSVSTWQAFTKMVFEHKSAEEAAQELNWAGTTAEELAKAERRVRQAKYRVVQRLRAEFGDLLDLQ